MAEAALTGYIVVDRGSLPINGELELSNIQLPSGMEAPKGALTLLFGYRETIGELQRRYVAAEKAGKELIAVKVVVDVGDRVKGRVGLKDLASQRYINFHRMTGDAENLLLQKWKRFLGPNPTEEEIDRTLLYSHSQFQVGRPDLLAYLHQEPEYSHIDVMAYLVPSPDGGFVQVATLFRRANVLKIECIDDPTARIRFPSSLPQ